jgi:diaminohydroxyphosphoribosylaminopyrimidine deaminase/5-amino-6-(5-phosphoribosylamino)uracil reductase
MKPALQVGERCDIQQIKHELIRSALQGVGFVSPNPLVGAVIVDREHRFLASGGHLQFGMAHAEVNAVKQLGANFNPELLRGAKVYVTLEPCAHQGKTPACSAMLKQYPLGEVIFAHIDPNPKVDGAGARILNDHGIAATHDASLSPETKFLTEPFMTIQRLGRPFVGLKVASTIDGMFAKQGDERAWITKKRARDYGHFLRMFYDGIVVGGSTVKFDNPTLNSRHPLQERRRDPSVVVLDRNGEGLLSRPPEDQHLLQVEGRKVHWVISQQTWQNCSGELRQGISECDRLEIIVGGFSILELLKIMSDRGIYSLLLEGGSHVWASFINEKLVDKLHLFQAPQLGFGRNSLAWSTHFDLSGQMVCQDLAITPLEDDWLLEASLS